MKNLILFLLLSGALYASSVATITALNGKASILRESKSIDATLGAKLKSKDSIITQNDTKVQLIFKDDTIITIGKNSTFSISEYIFDEQNEPIATFGLLKGAMRTITGKIGKIAPHKFKVKTKTATIGIRGTNFSIVSRGNVQEVYCTYGSIVLYIDGNEFVVEMGSYITIDKNLKVKIQKYKPAQLKKIALKNFNKKTKKPFKNDAQKVTNLEVSLEDKEIVVTEYNSQDKQDNARDNAQVDANQYVNVTSHHNGLDDTLHIYKGMKITNDMGIDTNKNSLGYHYSLIKTPLTEQNKYETSFTALKSFTNAEDVTDLNIALDNSFKLIDDDLSNYDSMEWGEWSITQKDSEKDIELRGLWVWGDLTDATVIASYNSSAKYDGRYKAIDAHQELVRGKAFLAVDFANDIATLKIKNQNSTSDWAIYSDMKIVSNTLNGSQDNSSGGFTTGAFYGTSGTSVGGSFSINDNQGQREANGVYQVTTTTIGEQ